MARTTTARVFFGYGSPGCLHDSQTGAMAFTRRRDLIEAFRDELASRGLPAYLVDQISWRRLWAQVRRVGASSVHVAVQSRRGGPVLELFGLTEAEFAEREAEDEFA